MPPTQKLETRAKLCSHKTLYATLLFIQLLEIVLPLFFLQALLGKSIVA